MNRAPIGPAERSSTPPTTPTGSAAAGVEAEAADERANAALIARLATAYNDRDVDALTEIFAPGYVEHGPEDYAAFFRWSWRVFGPNARLHLDHITADRDRVGCTTTLTGEFDEEEYGIAPTGASLTFPAVELFRVRDGRIVEHWDVTDRAGLLAQMRGFATTPAHHDGRAATDGSSGAATASQTNAAVIRAIGDAYTRRDTAALGQIFAPDYLEHAGEGFDGFFQWSLAAFPDAQLQLQHVVADEDRVGCVTVLTGTFNGTPAGPTAGRTPSGNVVSFAAVDLFWLRDGRVVEHRDAVGRRALLTQLDAGAEEDERSDEDDGAGEAAPRAAAR